RVSEITRRAMNGEIDFIAALEARVALLEGVEVGLLDKAAARIRLTSGALVSGGFTVFAEPIAATLGFDRVIANRLDLAQGRVSGKVLTPIVTGGTKR